MLGVEACVWTERIASEDRLFAMTFPRALALAEIAWTPSPARDWDGFLARVPPQLDWLAARGDAFRIPNVTFAFAGGAARFDAVPGHVQAATVRTAARVLTVSLSIPLRGATIRYTTDGSAPGAASRAYAIPFVVHVAARAMRLRAAAWYRGRRSTVAEAIVVRVPPRTLGTRGSRSWASLVSP